MYKFQEVDSEDERNGVTMDYIRSQDPRYKDIDSRTWEDRSPAPEGFEHGYQDEDEGYYDDTGEALSHADWEEMLFNRVLDKIRIARAAGNPDVELTPNELEAYQSRIHGTRSPAMRSQPRSQPLSPLDDTASVHSSSREDRHRSSTSSRSKKHRPSLFSSKSSKKDKEKEKSSRKRSSMSSASSQVSPSFEAPSPHDHFDFPQMPSQSSRAHARIKPVKDVVGAFPEEDDDWHPTPSPGTPLEPVWEPSTEQDAHAISKRPASIRSTKLPPVSISPYQHHNFSPVSSSPASPQAQFTRRVSSGPPEPSQPTLSRRTTAPVSSGPSATLYGEQIPPVHPANVFDYQMAPGTDFPSVPRATEGGGGEKKRKSRKKKG